MAESDQINALYRAHGWRCVKVLTELDVDYLPEDLAQFERDGTVVDFGFYGDSTNVENGEFAIYVIEAGNWKRPRANLRFTSVSLAFEILKMLASLPSDTIASSRIHLS